MAQCRAGRESVWVEDSCLVIAWSRQAIPDMPGFLYVEFDIAEPTAQAEYTPQLTAVATRDSFEFATIGHCDLPLALVIEALYECKRVARRELW